MSASGKLGNGRIFATSRSATRSSNFFPCSITSGWPWDPRLPLEQLRTGVDLIVKQMEEVLRSLNVQPVETAGAIFDPRIHEALEKVERDDLPDHQVLDEVRRGYRIRERLLRPALVRVVSNPQQKEV